jgi:hypothetical protein
MQFRATLVAAAALALLATDASATMRISDDVGGRIGAYVDQYTAARNSGERVVIDGVCLSACTLVLGIVPRNRICVTRRAMLGFHAAWMQDDDPARPRTDADVSGVPGQRLDPLAVPPAIPGIERAREPDERHRGHHQIGQAA